MSENSNVLDAQTRFEVARWSNPRRMATYRTILGRLQCLDGPDRVVDWIIYMRSSGELPVGEHPRYTADLSVAVAHVKWQLPGWWWSCGSCCVSDDARIAPDFNDPEHGPGLKAQFFPIEPGSELDAGFDIDRRPPGNPAIAMLEALYTALVWLHDTRTGTPVSTLFRDGMETKGEGT